MLTLAIDTSGLQGSIALVDGETCLAERSLELGGRHGQTLVPEVGRLFAEQKRTLRDCRLIGVSIGPGSFTGLRVGIVCAKTLAYAIGSPAVGVETFLAIAENTPGECAAVQVVEDAQRGDVSVGHYRREPDRSWQRAGEIAILPAEDWIAGLCRHDTVTGPLLARLQERVAQRCQTLPPECWRPRARVVGKLAQRLLATEATQNPWSLEPLYLRRSSAEDKWTALHGPGA